MSDQPLEGPSLSGPATLKFNVTLDPLHYPGQAALAPDPAADIANINLTSLAVCWRNAFNETTIRKADDLFACAASDGKYYDPVPKGAELMAATLAVQFTGAAGLSSVDITPPDTLKFQNPADAPRILALLARRGFQTAKNLVLAFLLTAAS